MQFAGLVLRDIDGFEWHGDYLRPKHHKELRDWRAARGSPWGTYSVAEYAGADAGGCAIGNFPHGFECYDPFQEEPALFAIAARLWERGEKRSNLFKTKIMAFANKWGDIADFPDACGSNSETWYDDLHMIQAIAKELKGAVPGNPRAGRATADYLRLSLLGVDLACDVITVPSGLQSRVMVIGLASSLRVQVSEAVIDRWVIRNCPNCGNPIAPSSSRTDRIFCSNSCRVQAYKQRKRKALELHGKKKRSNRLQ